MSERIKKLNDLIRDEVGKILNIELENENNILVTVVAGDISPTLEHATIKISVFPTDKGKEIITKINRIVFKIQKKLNSRLKMRPIPKIRFEIDTTEEHADRIENMLKNIN
ncbi:MAG TPA: ribosome-binding factor A [Candidatus Paceibacterota bacterium]